MLPTSNKWLKWTHEKMYLKVFPNYPTLLSQVIGDAASVLDVGCGTDSPLGLIPKTFKSTGVDIYGPSIEESRRKNIHDDYIQIDVLSLSKYIEPNSYDCVIASDLIEHLNKTDGEHLLGTMEKIARKKVVIYTTNGFIPQAEIGGNQWQRHLSGWTPEEMRRRGYRVIGCNGWKRLRGELAQLKFKPLVFWHLISDLTGIYTRFKPESAYHILCVKTIKSS